MIMIFRILLESMDRRFSFIKYFQIWEGVQDKHIGKAGDSVDGSGGEQGGSAEHWECIYPCLSPNHHGDTWRIIYTPDERQSAEESACTAWWLLEITTTQSSNHPWHWTLCQTHPWFLERPAHCLRPRWSQKGVYLTFVLIPPSLSSKPVWSSFLFLLVSGYVRSRLTFWLEFWWALLQVKIWTLWRENSQKSSKAWFVSQLNFPELDYINLSRYIKNKLYRVICNC